MQSSWVGLSIKSLHYTDPLPKLVKIDGIKRLTSGKASSTHKDGRALLQPQVFLNTRAILIEDCQAAEASCRNPFACVLESGDPLALAG